MNKPLNRKETDEKQWYFSLTVAFQIVKMNVFFFF
jgi:hypothetical protein